MIPRSHSSPVAGHTLSAQPQRWGAAVRSRLYFATLVAVGSGVLWLLVAALMPAQPTSAVPVTAHGRPPAPYHAVLGARGRPHAPQRHVVKRTPVRLSSTHIATPHASHWGGASKS